MPSLFETTFNTRVMPAVERAFGVSVTLTRGVLVSDAFTARRDDVDAVGFGGETGAQGKITRRDYWLPIASCVLDDGGGDTQVRPRAGDVITEGSETWEVYAPDDQTPASEEVAGAYDWLVHTRRVA